MALKKRKLAPDFKVNAQFMEVIAKQLFAKIYSTKVFSSIMNIKLYLFCYSFTLNVLSYGRYPGGCSGYMRASLSEV